MRANTKLTIKQADIIIDVPLAEFGSLDWRRSKELIVEGYKAAEAMRDQPAAARGLGGRVHEVAGGPRRAPPQHAAGADVLARRGLQLERRAAAHRSARAPHRRGLQCRDASRPTSRCSPASIATRPSPGDSSRTPPARTASLVAGAAQAVRPAVHDAGPQPREHDLRGLPGHLHRPLSRVRRARLRLGAAHRRHARIGSGSGVRATTGRLAARRCSSSRTPASSIAPST